MTAEASLQPTYKVIDKQIEVFKANLPQGVIDACDEAICALHLNFLLNSDPYNPRYSFSFGEVLVGNQQYTVPILIYEAGSHIATVTKTRRLML